MGVTQNGSSEYNNEAGTINEDNYEVNMTSEHIDDYIKARQGKLLKDEISLLFMNNQIDHIQFDHDKYKCKMWDTTGKCFEFCEKG